MLWTDPPRARECAVKPPRFRGAQHANDHDKRSRQSVSTSPSRSSMSTASIGGQVVIRRELKRRCVLAFLQKLTPCLVGIEARSSRHWLRELQALGHG
jgi:hypothetical protein